VLFTSVLFLLYAGPNLLGNEFDCPRSQARGAPTYFIQKCNHGKLIYLVKTKLKLISSYTIVTFDFMQ